MSLFSSFNSLTISGNVGRDPDFNFTTNGLSICKFSVAVSGWDSKEKTETTFWMNVVCFGKTAEHAEKWVVKGTKVLVQGPLKEENWTDKEGNPRKSYSVICNDLTLLDKVNKGATATERQSAKSKPKSDTGGYWVEGSSDFDPYHDDV